MSCGELRESGKGLGGRDGGKRPGIGIGIGALGAFGIWMMGIRGRGWFNFFGGRRRRGMFGEEKDDILESVRRVAAGDGKEDGHGLLLFYGVCVG